jgi:hypothetical protein
MDANISVEDPTSSDLKHRASTLETEASELSRDAAQLRLDAARLDWQAAVKRAEANKLRDDVERMAREEMSSS